MPIPTSPKKSGVEELYDALHEDGYVTLDINGFRSKLQTEANCKELYDALSEDGYVTLDYDGFKKKLGISYSGDAALSSGHQHAAGVSQPVQQTQGANPQAEQQAQQQQPTAGQTLFSGDAGADVGAAGNVRAAAGADAEQVQMGLKPSNVMQWQAIPNSEIGHDTHKGATVVADSTTGKQIAGISQGGEQFTQRVENRHTGRGLYFNDDTPSMRGAMEDWQRLDGFVTPEAQRIKDAAMTDDPF